MSSTPRKIVSNHQYVTRTELDGHLAADSRSRLDKLIGTALSRNDDSGYQALFQPLSAEFTRQMDHVSETRMAAILDAGTPENTRRAYESDLRYFWVWFCLRYPVEAARAPFYPIDKAVVATFLTDHMCGLPAALEHAMVNTVVYSNGRKQHTLKAVSRFGLHKPSVLRRRLATLGRMHRPYSPSLNPAREPVLLELLASYQKILAKQVEAHRADAHRNPDAAEWVRLGTVTQKAPLDMATLEKLLATCEPSVRGDRDRALLWLGAATGGRRRSELAKVCAEQIQDKDDYYLVDFGITKTNQSAERREKPVLGEAADALRTWFVVSKIKNGPVFRAFKSNGELRESAISDRAIANMIKERAKLAGLDPTLFSGHSIRAGFMTEAGMQGENMFAAMEMSDHSDPRTAKGYFRLGKSVNNPTAKLFEKNK